MAERKWHQHRLNMADQAVTADLNSFWTNDMYGDITASYQQILTTPADYKLVWFNSASPSIQRAPHTKFAQEMCAAIINEPDTDNIGLSMMPAFDHRDGQVWKSELTLLQKLSDGGVDVDKSFSIQYERPHHARDERPLLQLGRVLKPLEKKQSASVWKKGLSLPVCRVSALVSCQKVPTCTWLRT
jgi:hypothetical protein